ncbi:receptor-like protein kinase HSL1 [Momordica charantia]|uniref:Receptor-like protein kinase HSL1 n=1 Tax=Momordica charantia TaxID=3673 RepID=A0A6J1BVN1_MOMCH|nr:receptor-like protein kinase HSL1 [Momordica charantia]
MLTTSHDIFIPQSPIHSSPVVFLNFARRIDLTGVTMGAFEMSRLPLPVFIFYFISIPFYVSSQTVSTDHAILLKLKEQWGNPPSLWLWNSSSSPCDWPEIVCREGVVTGISLGWKNITGGIPASICNLKNLTALDLSWNYIPGEFPEVLYNCSNLKYLDLSGNYFVGPIPQGIDRIQTLQYMDLGANNFSGDIPATIGRLSDLRTLNICRTQLNGTLPVEIGNLSNLETLKMAYNTLLVPSPIPQDFGKLKKLKYLWLTKSNLISEIPESILDILSLEHLDLSCNNLVGSIPAALFSLQNLSNLYLYQNHLSGEIPRSIRASNLLHVDLSTNNLTGTIPEDFGKLKRLEVLNLFENHLSGEIPGSLGLIPTLKDLRVFNNNLTGGLPQELGLHSNLKALEVSNNTLSGQLPEHLCKNGVLQGVVAFSNHLSGELPKGLGSCRTLRIVQLSNNNFSGEIPLGLWTTFNLSIVILDGNSFTGKLPDSLSWNLTRLQINNNKFWGQIPDNVSSWRNLVVFEAGNNLLSGKIPEELTNLPHLTTLVLNGNQLSGRLPSTIVSWESLNTLNLSRNELSGHIPAAIGSLPSLIYLDLSANNFSGEIPPEIGHLKLASLNLSSNQLSGRIPDEYENLAYGRSFLNNTNLCTTTDVLNLPTCYSRQRDSKGQSYKYLPLILALIVTMLVIALLWIFFLYRGYYRKDERCHPDTWKLTSFQRLDFTEANILSNLTETNLIGSGGSGKVYCIDINCAGYYVAVKRIWSNRKLDQKLEKEFQAEVQILGSIRHSNIVKLLCCVWNENSKLLVYEYMQNQSLDKWLHKRKRRLRAAAMDFVDQFVLDWPRRLQIAIGAAQGLSYMHHDCSPPIIHRDVKSSNILLDREFQARIADFGLAKMLARQGEPHTLSGIAGSFGYIAPEYAYRTKVNEKIDVYSFGVVLLELTTGREPNCGDEHTSLAEWAWQQYNERKPIIDAFDEEITSPCYLEEMTTLFKLGLICTSTLPEIRPSMKEVLHVLRQCSPSEDCDGRKIAGELNAVPVLGTPI